MFFRWIVGFLSASTFVGQAAAGPEKSEVLTKALLNHVVAVEMVLMLNSDKDCGGVKYEKPDSFEFMVQVARFAKTAPPTPESRSDVERQVSEFAMDLRNRKGKDGKDIIASNYQNLKSMVKNHASDATQVCPLLLRAFQGILKNQLNALE